MRRISLVYPPALSGLLLSVWLLAAAAPQGCKKSTSDKDQSKVSTESPGAGTQSEEELNAVLATIDGVEIRVREFQERINRQSPYIRARYTSNEQKKEFLENLIRFEVLAMQAKKEGFDKNPDVIRTMKQVMIQKLMKDRFENGISPDDVTDAEMNAHYEKNHAEFHKPEEVRVSAIIVSKKAAGNAAAKAALGDKGSSNKGFRELVAQFSTDEDTKLRGGDLRYFTADNTEIPKEVVAAAFLLKKTGDVAGPIATSDKRFYIIKQTGHRKAIDKTFDQVKRQLQNRIYRDKRTQAQKDFVQGLKQSAKIQIFEDKLGQVKIDTSAAAAGEDSHQNAHLPAMPPEGHSETPGPKPPISGVPIPGDPISGDPAPEQATP